MVGPTVHHLAPHLFLIVMTPPISGFQQFIGAWLIKGPDATILVDVGPAATVAQLTTMLNELSVGHLDYICLTHIHIDHAGAVGHLADHFPEAVVVCHPAGAAHLVDPERLWQGTVKALGDTGRAYGRMLPVAPSRIASGSELDGLPLTRLDTPGHAPHHTAYATPNWLFAGEAGGVCLPLSSSRVYLRPATPPRFFLETSLSSIARLMAVDCQTICYGHFGWRQDGKRLLALHRDQLLRWADLLSHAGAGARTPSPDDLNAWVDRLLRSDPLLDGFDRLPSAVQNREWGFLMNSVKGFAGYLAAGGRSSRDGR